MPTQISMMSKPVESVRILILGGEECRLEAMAPWVDGKRNVFNTYGPTDATVIATCGVCAEGIKPSIGKPAPNYSIFMLDRNQRPVSAGVIGELCIGGYCLAREYLNRSELTSQKFITPQFTVGNDFPQRLYRSGDRARFAPDGSIQFAGRIDDQVKLRGQRIELGEIEAAIVRVTGARQVAVALHTNKHQIQSLTAYIVPEEGKSIIEKEMRDALKQFLPSYMIPAYFCSFTELPVLSSGKIDRKRLATLEITKTGSDRELIAPITEMHKTLHAVWMKYFNRNDISITDDFFDIGGHSLLAATIVSELRTHAGLESLPLHLYRHASLSPG